MFNVPRRAGNHPRLALGILAGLFLLVVGLVGWGLIRPASAPEVRSEPLPPRPPVEVVETLPGLKGQLDHWGATGQFTGGVLVARGDQVLFRQVYGPANREEGRAMALNTRFRLASISKQFTAAAILRLQDEGKLSVDDPVCKYIQPCPAAWQPIRLRHLLSHTSGIPDLMARPGWGVRRVTPATPAELTEDSKRFGLQFEPGTKVRYNNAGFNLLGAVVEEITGMGLHDYLRQAFFDPLGMADTGYDDGGPDMAMGYANLVGGIAPQPKANVSIVYAAGALYSTLDDLLIWERALHRGHILSSDSYRQMIADHAPDDTPDERGKPRRLWGYGIYEKALGRQVQPAFDDNQIFHTGSWSGFRNLMTYQPDEDVTVIVLSNNYHQREAVFLLSQQGMAEALGRDFPTVVAR
ncbi:MAG: serine hydrolase domain-containing protein [Brevundimonas sp.]|nr:serine hydrolase domain-containing protein [Brevundimonas sp.]